MKKKGQVWIETVTYTLVAFILISLILSFAKPKIEQLQDQTVIQQSIQMMRDIDTVVRDVEEQGIGNKRKLEINLRKGTFTIDSSNDSLIFYMEGKHMYSQPGQEYYEGNLKVLTQENGKTYTITVTKEYRDFNISYDNSQIKKSVSRGTTPYSLYISNEGGSDNKINFEFD